MANQIAQPTFVAGADDKLAAVDVYKTQQQVGQVVNSIQSLLKKYDPQLARSLAGYNSLEIQSIARTAIGNANSKSGSAALDLFNRASQLNPNLASTIRSMDAAVRANLSAAMAGIGSAGSGMVGQAKGALPKNGNFGPEFGQLGSGTFGMGTNSSMTAIVGDVKSSVKVDDIFQTKQMCTAVNQMTGKDSIVLKDSAAEVGLYTGVVKETMSSGISGITKDIFAVITDRQIMGIVSREILPDIVKYSSVDDLHTLATSLPKGELLGATPSLLNIISRSFGTNNKSQFHSSQYNTSHRVYSYQDILNAFAAVDPNWNRYQRGDETVVSVASLMGATSAFNEIIKVGALNSNQPLEKPYLIAQLLTTESVVVRLSRQYPRTKFYFDAKVSKVVDPRSLGLA